MAPAARLLPWVCLLFAACASGPFEPTSVVAGDTRDDVLRKMGPPTASYTMPGRQDRLEYTRMPAGRKTYMIDFDAAGRVTRWEQVLDEAHFLAIVPGLRSADVLRLIGVVPLSNDARDWESGASSRVPLVEVAVTHWRGALLPLARGGS